MSMVQELIAAVTNAERQIDEQAAKLNGYLNELNQVISKVEAALSGSQQEYGIRMIEQLTATKTQVQQILERLQTAKDKLLQVRMI